jgi:hypothetical protein
MIFNRECKVGAPSEVTSYNLDDQDSFLAGALIFLLATMSS